MKRISAILLIFIFALAGCGKETAKVNPVRKEFSNGVKEAGIPVEVAVVQKKQLQEILKFTGDIEGKDQVQVYPKVPGKLIEYKVEEGARVEKQDVIALIDRDVTGFKFEPAPVEAPISGIVAKTYFDQGDSVSPQVPIAVVADMDEVKVKIEIVEVDYPKVKLGQIAKIIVDAYPDKEFTGKLSKFSALVDLDTRTATAEITIPNPDHLLIPGMFARISLFVGKHKALVVPRDAILRLPGTGVYYCFVVQENKAKKVFVELGMRENNWQEVNPVRKEFSNGVKEELKMSDLVILSGQGILKTDMPVEIKKRIEGEKE